MACFLVPAGEAIIVSGVSKIIEKKGRKQDSSSKTSGATTMQAFLSKRSWLTKLLWGGSALLAFEHVWHGEVVPWFPFLSAAYNPEDTIAMLQEMSTVGVVMALVVTIVWIGMVCVSISLEKKKEAICESSEERV